MATHRNLLIVEDTRWMARELARSLLPRKADILGTIAEAQNALSSNAYSGLIIDERLPDGSGLALLEWARDQRIHSPAVIWTAWDLAPLVDRVHELDGDVLTKRASPLAFKPFLARVDNAAGLVGLATEAASTKSLSEQQAEILIAHVRGIPRGALADEIGVKESSLKTQIGRLLLKLGAENLDDVLRGLLRDFHR